MITKRTHIALALAALFASGAVAGAVLGRHQATLAAVQPMSAADHTRAVLRQMQTELALSPEQGDQLRPTIEAAVRKGRALAQRQRVERVAFVDEVERNLAPQLTEAQRERLRTKRATTVQRFGPFPKQETHPVQTTNP